MDTRVIKKKERRKNELKKGRIFKGRKKRKK